MVWLHIEFIVTMVSFQSDSSSSLILCLVRWSGLIDVSGMMRHHGFRAGLQLSHVAAADGTAEY